jgi:hypothetical protein
VERALQPFTVYPLINSDEWFQVMIIENGDNLIIEKLTNPIGTINQMDIIDLLNYIKEFIFPKVSKTSEM